MLKSKVIGGAVAAMLLITAPLVGSSGLVGSAHAQAAVSFNVFFDQLAPHGVWVKSDRYDYVWCPSVDTNWAPYSRGHWVYLAARGWYFNSDEPFAWAAYHYGRWYRDTNVGWCWVPGNVWAPAWVSWRRSNDYVGWAPLAPQGQGYAVGTTIAHVEEPQEDWAFVPTRQFLAPQLSTTIIFGAQQPDVYRRTKDVGPVVVQNNVVVNTVIDLQFIEQQTGTKVQQVKVQTTDKPQTSTQVTNQTVQVFNPTFQKPAANEAPKQAVAPAEAKQKLSTITPVPSPPGTPNRGNAGQTPSGGANTAPAGQENPPAAGGSKPQSGRPSDNSSASPSRAGSGAGAAAGGNDKATLCPADEVVVNGKCQPPKPNQVGKPDAHANPGSSNSPAQEPTSTGGNKTAGAHSGTGSNAETAPANNNQASPPSAAGRTNASSNNGGGSKSRRVTDTTCPPNEVVVAGKCSPKVRGATSDGTPSAGSTNGTAGTTAAPANAGDRSKAGPGESSDHSNQLPAVGGKPGPSKLKGAKCPPGEEMVQGVCQPTTSQPDGAGKGDNQPSH